MKWTARQKLDISYVYFSACSFPRTCTGAAFLSLNQQYTSIHCWDIPRGISVVAHEMGDPKCLFVAMIKAPIEKSEIVFERTSDDSILSTYRLTQFPPCIFLSIDRYHRPIRSESMGSGSEELARRRESWLRKSRLWSESRSNWRMQRFIQTNELFVWWMFRRGRVESETNQS